MPVTRVNDINMYYEIHGEGDPLILIMGLGGDHFRWFRILPLLAENFKVLTFDNRGVGKTDKPDIPYTMKMMLPCLWMPSVSIKPILSGYHWEE